jgi:hypothetical protein
VNKYGNTGVYIVSYGCLYPADKSCCVTEINQGNEAKEVMNEEFRRLGLENKKQVHISCR